MTHDTVSPIDYGALAQKTAEEHITGCWDAFHQAEEAQVDAELAEIEKTNPAIGAFDGCTTCEVREILAVALPIIGRGLLAGAFTAEDLVAEGESR